MVLINSFLNKSIMRRAKNNHMKQCSKAILCSQANCPKHATEYFQLNETPKMGQHYNFLPCMMWCEESCVDCERNWSGGRIIAAGSGDNVLAGLSGKCDLSSCDWPCELSAIAEPDVDSKLAEQWPEVGARSPPYELAPPPPLPGFVGCCLLGLNALIVSSRASPPKSSHALFSKVLKIDQKKNVYPKEWCL